MESHPCRVTIYRLAHEGTIIETRHSSTDRHGSCQGSGSVTVTANLPSVIYRKNVDQNVAGCFGHDVPPEGMYALIFKPSASFPYTCIYGGTSSESSTGFLAPTVGNLHSEFGGNRRSAIRECGDPEERKLEGGGGVMRGAFSSTCADFQLEATWSICREGVECPPPPELPGESRGGPQDEDPCGDPMKIRAPLDLAMDQQRSYLDQLQKLLGEHERLQQQAAQWQGDFEHATRDCRLWSVARILLNFLMSNWAPTTPGRALPVAPGRPVAQVTPDVNAGKEFVNFLSFVEKALAADRSWLLPNTEYGPGGREWLSLEDLWDGYKMAYGALGESSPQELREKLQNCGAPTISAVYDGALQYLRLLEQIKPLAQRMNEAMNQMRDKDIELFNLWNKYQDQCLEYQRCSGSDPAACNQWPPPGPLVPDAPP